MTSAITSLPLAEPTALAAADEVIATAISTGAEARLLGGIAIALRCPSARKPAPLARSYSDIDLIINRKGTQSLTRALKTLGYAPEERFNALHGHSRLIFDRDDGIHVDVFVDTFVMCHRLPLADRLHLHDRTVSLADLLLTKLQVAALNAKDVTDSTALLLDHDLADDEQGLHVGYMAGLLGRDWGWWRTASENLQTLRAHVEAYLPDAAVPTVTSRIDRLITAIDQQPKGVRWRARAKVGDRMPWRDDPEEQA